MGAKLMTSKTQGWEIRLADYIKKMHGKPFKRGQHDCALFAGHCIDIMTGKDTTSEFQKPYKNRKEAMALLKKLGYANLEAVATEKLGERMDNLNFAGRGDCVTVPCAEGVALAIVDLSGKKAVTTGKNGLEYYNRTQWLNAWKV